MLPYRWEELTAPEFNEAVEKSKGLCIMPLGCLERHGEHLVVGCDSYIANYVSGLAAANEYAVIFPTGFWLGEVTGNHALTTSELDAQNKRGYIALKSETLLKILAELCDEIHRNGFRKILIINSHGGNVPLLNYFVRSQMYEKKNYATMWTWANQPSNDIDFVYEQALLRREEFNLNDEQIAFLAKFNETGFGGGHADLQEVAINYAESPKLVRPELFDSQSGASTHQADYLTKMGVIHGGAWGANFPNAYDGFPSTGCTQNVGKVFGILAAERLEKIFKVLKEDEFCVKISQRDI